MHEVSGNGTADLQFCYESRVSHFALVGERRPEPMNSSQSENPGWWRSWKLRHQHPVSFALHLVGIPLTIAAVVIAVIQLLNWRWDLWYRPVVLLAVGYLLQWIGHFIEGNTMGELILIRKMTGKPYDAIAPRYRDASGDSCSDTDNT